MCVSSMHAVSPPAQALASHLAAHPLCEFCRTHFYGTDEMYAHMTQEHFTVSCVLLGPCLRMYSLG